VEPLTQTEPIHSVGESSSSVLPEPLEPSTDKEPQPSESTFSTDEVEADLKPLPQPKQEQTESLDEKEDLWVDSPDKEPEASKVLIQAELAKRLDVHSSTVGKRKSDPDFSEWSQSRDPEGIAWVYSPDTKEFLPLEKKPESEQ
jgi:hypothetical protein